MLQHIHDTKLRRLTNIGYIRNVFPNHTICRKMTHNEIQNCKESVYFNSLALTHISETIMNE